MISCKIAEMLTKSETKIVTGNYASNMGIRDFVQKMGCYL